MKTYYTEKAWHRAAVEGPRNPSFTIIEIEFYTGDVLVVADCEYPDVAEELDYCETYRDGGKYEGNPKDVLHHVTIYKIVDSIKGA